MEADLHRVFTALHLHRHPQATYARWYREAIGDHELGWLWSLLTYDCLSDWVIREFPLNFEQESPEILYRLMVRGEMDKACLVAHALRHESVELRLIAECLVEYPAKMVPSGEWWLSAKARLHGLDSSELWTARILLWIRERKTEGLSWYESLVSERKLANDAPHYDLLCKFINDNTVCVTGLPLWFQFHFAAWRGEGFTRFEEYALSLADPLLALDYLTYLAEQGPYRRHARRIYSQSAPLRRRRMRCMTRNFDLLDLLAWMHSQESRLVEGCLRAAWYHAQQANDAAQMQSLVEKALRQAASQSRHDALQTLSQLSADGLHAAYLQWRTTEDPADLMSLISLPSIPSFMHAHLLEAVELLQDTALLQDSQIITVLLGWLGTGMEHMGLRRILQNEAIRLLMMK